MEREIPNIFKLHFTRNWSTLPIAFEKLPLASSGRHKLCHILPWFETSMTLLAGARTNTTRSLPLWRTRTPSSVRWWVVQSVGCGGWKIINPYGSFMTLAIRPRVCVYGSKSWWLCWVYQELTTNTYYSSTRQVAVNGTQSKRSRNFNFNRWNFMEFNQLGGGELS